MPTLTSMSNSTLATIPMPTGTSSAFSNSTLPSSPETLIWRKKYIDPKSRTGHILTIFLCSFFGTGLFVCFLLCLYDTCCRKSRRKGNSTKDEEYNRSNGINHGAGSSRNRDSTGRAAAASKSKTSKAVKASNKKRNAAASKSKEPKDDTSHRGDPSQGDSTSPAMADTTI